MAPLKAVKFGSVVTKMQPFSSRLLATCPTKPLQKGKETEAFLERVEDAKEYVNDKAESVANSTKEKLFETMDKVSEKASEMKDFASDKMENIRDTTGEKYYKAMEVIQEEIADAKSFASNKFEQVKDEAEEKYYKIKSNK